MLSQFLITELFAFMLVFCRLGSALMLMPGFGELYVATRVRLLLAVLFSILVAQVIKDVPPMPSSLSVLLPMMLAEILIGLFLGSMGRFMIAAIHMAGSIIAYQASLSSSLTQNITSFQGQESSLGNLLSLTAVVLIFILDIHHIALRGLADSYTLFLPGHFPFTGDIAKHIMQVMSSAFIMAMQIAAPNIAIGVMLYLGAGILSRLMPNMQIFFIMMAPQIMVSLFILMVSLSAIMLWYTEYYKAHWASFIAP